MTYHNTTTITGEQLTLFTVKAGTQERLVYEMFKKYGMMTASECLSRFSKINTPITSIRRAFCSLYDQGLISKEKETKIGIYGRPEHYYKIIP